MIRENHWVLMVNFMKLQLGLLYYGYTCLAIKKSLMLKLSMKTMGILSWMYEKTKRKNNKCFFRRMI